MSSATMRVNRRMLRLPKSLVLGLAAGLLLSACSGDDEPSSDPSESPSESAAAPGDPETWPLTGLPVKGGDEAALEHPILVAKMDNTSGSSPQAGLGEADLVVEELVEGGVTRLAAFYYSELPREVGPVRSMRASDIGIVPEGAQVVTSGAAEVTIDRIDKAGITFFSEGAKGLYRAADRTAPYNLMASLANVADTIDQKAARPEDYLPWGDAKDLPKGKPATSIQADFGNHATQWEFRGGSYVNTNSFAAADDQFTADTVLVMRVDIVDAGYTDPAGYPVPESRVVGQGDVQIFHDGEVVTGRWSKEELRSPIELETKSGDPLTVPAGHTWIELVPTKDGGVTFTK